VLDIGSGCGEMLTAARQLGLNASGVETSSVFAEFAREHYDVDVNNCSLEDADYPAESFDVAIMAAVIEHLYEPRSTVREAWRVLKHGGLLWLDAPNEASLASRAANVYLHMRGGDWTSYLSPTFPPYHVQGFTPKSLRYLLESVGFDIVDWRIFPAKTVWPCRKGPLVHFEYYAEMLVHTVERVARTGSYMEALVTKTTARRME